MWPVVVPGSEAAQGAASRSAPRPGSRRSAGIWIAARHRRR